MPALPWVTKDHADVDQECVLMASRLPLAHYRHIPSFLRATMRIRKQLATADGLLGYSVDARLLSKRFFTLSAWRSREALEAFSRANPHAHDVAGIRPNMRPTTFVFWTARAGDLPIAWADARRRIDEKSAG